MKRWTVWAAAVCVWIAAAGAPVRAQEPAQTPLRLDLPAAVSMAMERNHEVLRARERIRQLEGRITEVKSQAYPRLGLEAAYRRSYDESFLDLFDGFIPPEEVDFYSLKGTLDQILFSWGRVSTAIEIARVAREQARWQQEAVERDVKLRVHEAFYDLLLARRLVEVAEETLAQKKRHLDVARKRFQAGVVNEFEVVRARVAVANARPPVIQARNRVRQAVAKLNNLLARPQDAPLEPQGELDQPPLPVRDLSAVIERAWERRPELQALVQARDLAQKNLTLARAEDKPTVGLRAEYGFATQEWDRLDFRREQWSVGVQMTWPFFDSGKTRGKIAQARSQLRDVQIALDQSRQGIALEAKVALDAVEEAEKIIEAAGHNIEQARRALELAEASYRYGVGTTLDVTDAELGLTAARTDHARALRDYLVARARVLAVMNDL
ncbi:TolC family protein [Deferrisoma camini]|uniref:TolC family protein n=1 Tax=Deferrisoma camini TaxID=1035120 RepID=UPI00046CE7AF|nr:TolC family protein [Deferrisoma camini]